MLPSLPGPLRAAACIRSFVTVNTCTVLTTGLQGKFTIIKDCAKIADNTVIPPNTVVPAMAIFAGSPGMSAACNLHTSETYTYSQCQSQVASLKTCPNQRQRWLRHRRNSITPDFNRYLQKGDRCGCTSRIPLPRTIPSTRLPPLSLPFSSPPPPCTSLCSRILHGSGGMSLNATPNTNAI